MAKETLQETIRKANASGLAASKITGIPFTPLTASVGAGSSTSPTTSPQQTGINEALFSEIQNQLVNQAGAVSSANTGLEQSIKNAMGFVQEGTQAESQRIESAFGREIEFAQGQAQQNIQGHLEGRSGFATQMVAFRNLVETTDKNLNDLEQRKNELILQNNATGAAKLAELEIQALEYRQQAGQQMFNNILGLGNFALGVEDTRSRLAMDEKRLALSERSQQFSERQAAANVALEFGLSLEDGEDIEGIVTRAAPLANERQVAELELLKSQIANQKAQTAKVHASMMDATKGREISPFTEFIINGDVAMDSLSATQREVVFEDLSALGFQNERPPEWFSLSKFGPASVSQLGRDELQSEWTDKRETIMLGPKASPQLVQSFFGQEALSKGANRSKLEVASYVDRLVTDMNNYRKAGIDMKNILELISN